MSKLETPLVSIVVPAYNEEKFIGDCIESIRRQDGIAKEIIVINDGSTDDTQRLLECFSGEDLVLLNTPNVGAGAARNIGLERASGEFVAFLDADDMYYDEDAIFRMVKACRTNKTEICASYRCEMRNGIAKDADLFRDLGPLTNEGLVLSFREHQYDFFFQSYVYKREFIEEHLLRFPPYRRYEDPPFLLRALHAASRFVVVPVTLHCYRKGHQNRLENRKYITDSLRGVRSNIEFALDNGYRQLAQTTIMRCESMFREDILEHADPDTASIIKSINSIGLSQNLINRDLSVIQELKQRGII